MKTHSRRVQPYHAADREYLPLACFTLQSAPLLWPQFRPLPQWSETVEEPDGRSSLVYGNEQLGLLIRLSPYRGSGRVSDTDEVIVGCQGLPDGLSLELRAFRNGQEPRSIVASVTGPEDHALTILAGFEECFNVDGSDPGWQRSHLRRLTRSAIGLSAWHLAELNASEMLMNDPHDPEALMYLGIAKAAQGYAPEGEGLLLASLTMDPMNADAYYHLGVILLNQGRCMTAVDSLRQVLQLVPGERMALYHLGRALERLGRLPEALKSYRESLKQASTTTTLLTCLASDITKELEDSVVRVERAIAGGGELPREGVFLRE
ncbi:MAG: tetratricopeptide repeat protein [Candidatus Thorarchaeota archaeon]|nr:tetratricopeptide repeat protein [Candidatus Thorarchaeota archaeon]